MADGWLYDGINAIRRLVTIERDGDLIRVVESGAEATILAPGELIPGSRRPDALVYRRSGQDGWRLGITRPIEPDLMAVLPQSGDYGRWIDRIGLGKAAIVGAFVSALVLGAGYFAPGWVAPFIPASLEKRYGDVLVGDFGEKFCTTPDGSRALRKLAKRVSQNGPEDFDVRIVNVPIVNAAALPGGHIVMFRGLVDQAENPDEIAGVLAHEIAHVRNRHVTEALIRQFGFSLILASVGGGTAGNVDALMTMTHSRGAEREADSGAIVTLNRASISPAPTAAFFQRMASPEEGIGRIGDVMVYLSTHPQSRERRDMFARSVERGIAYRPALTANEWSALQGICTDASGSKASSGTLE